MSKTYRQVPHWATRESKDRWQQRQIRGQDGGTKFSSTHAARPGSPKGYSDHYEVTPNSAAFNKRRASHINRRRGRAQVAALLREADELAELELQDVQEIMERLDYQDDYSEWLDEHDYNHDWLKGFEPEPSIEEDLFYENSSYYDQDRAVPCTCQNAAQQAACGNRLCSASAAHKEASPL